MQEITTKARVLRCPCGRRMQASDDGALLVMLREHIERALPYAKSPPEDHIKELVSSAVYGFEYVPVGEHDGLEEEGFGPEPY